MQVSGLGIFGSPWAAQGQLRGEFAVSEPLQLTVGLAALRTRDGDLRMRDSILGLRFVPLRTDKVVLSLEPGISFPTGSIAANAGPLQTTTGSVDPTLATDLVVGARVIGMLGGNARFPLVQGRDGLRQGIFARGDLRGGVRAGDFVPWVGASALRQTASANGTATLTEIAAIAGVWFTPFESSGIGAQLRVPLATDATETYPVAVGLTWRTVFRARDKDAH